MKKPEASRSRIESEVFELDRMSEDEALPQSVFGHERDSLRDRVDGALDLDRSALDPDFPGALRVDPEQNASKRAAAAAEQARNADHLAGVEREIDVFWLALAAESAKLEQRRAARSARDA